MNDPLNRYGWKRDRVAIFKGIPWIVDSFSTFRGIARATLIRPGGRFIAKCASLRRPTRTQERDFLEEVGYV